MALVVFIRLARNVAGVRLGWVSPWTHGINQGALVLMVEDYRSGLIWNLLSRCD